MNVTRSYVKQILASESLEYHGQFLDTTPEDADWNDTAGIIKWNIQVKNHLDGGVDDVDDPVSINKNDDPWIEFKMSAAAPQYFGHDKYQLIYVGGLYKTLHNFYEIHLGDDFGSDIFFGKGLATKLYQCMINWAHQNNIKVASSLDGPNRIGIRNIYKRLSKNNNITFVKGRYFIE